MAYVEIPEEWLDAGQPTKEEIFKRMRENQEHFNTSIESLNQTSNFDIINTRFMGSFNQYTLAQLNTRMPIFKAPVTGSITSVVVTLLESSSSGNLQIMVEKSTNNGVSWTPLLTTPATVTGTTVGSLSGSITWVNVAAQQFNQNNLIRIQVEGIKATQGGFHVSIYGELGA